MPACRVKMVSQDSCGLMGLTLVATSFRCIGTFKSGSRTLFRRMTLQMHWPGTLYISRMMWQLRRGKTHVQSLGLDMDDVREAAPDLCWPAREGAPPQRLSTAERREAYSGLSSRLCHTISPPVALGQGHTDTASKAACLMYILALECVTPEQFHGACNSIVAYCTDMGPELSVPSFQGSRMSLLPSWHKFAPGAGPVFHEDAAQDIHDEDAGLLPKAVSIPGICHIIHNLSADIDASMDAFPPFLVELKNVGALLCKDQSRKRLWQTCVRPLGAAPQQLFERHVPSIYEARWAMSSCSYRRPCLCFAYCADAEIKACFSMVRCRRSRDLYSMQSNLV